MKWNYRIVRLLNHQGFGLFQVFYDDVGNPVGMCEAMFLSNLEEGSNAVLVQLQMAIADAQNNTVLTEPEGWKETEGDNREQGRTKD